MIALAAAALALVALTWAGYPLIATLIASRRPPPTRGTAPHPAPRAVTVVLATRDLPAVVVERVRDLRGGHQPEQLLDIVVAVDVASPYAAADYGAVLPAAVRVVPGDEPGGKAATLNAGVRAAQTEILVFADSGQRFAPAAIPELVHFLSNCDFGAVSGAYETRHDSASPVLRAFWWLETRIRRAEARIHSLVAVTGAIYAMHKSLWRPLPAALICDDLYVPLHVAARGFRVGYCETAIAWDARAFDRRQEFSRKVRTLTGMLQVCRWCPWVLSPRANPLWLQFVFHKLLRLATPYLILVGLGAASWALAARGFWPELAVALSLAGVAALAGPGAWALSLQAAPIVATFNAIRGRWSVWSVPNQERAIPR
jgi:cellulose synthase/poly-beta-1,6-N-acetylglucosamine synthase-like glycosyltransferase